MNALLLQAARQLTKGNATPQLQNDTSILDNPISWIVIALIAAVIIYALIGGNTEKAKRKYTKRVTKGSGTKETTRITQTITKERRE